MSHALADALRRAGFDVLTAEQAGTRGRPDLDHLRLAAAEGRVLYSFNKADYSRIHRDFMRAGENHLGIVVAGHRPRDIGSQLRGLIHVSDSLGAAGMVNWLAVV